LRYRSKDKHAWSGTKVAHHRRFHCSAFSELQSLCYLVVTLNDYVAVTHLLLNLINNVQRGLPAVAMVGRLINRFKETEWP
jgi:hypothetical protein